MPPKSNASDGKVLVIDSYREARYLMQEILRHQFGCAVTAVASLVEGFHALENESFSMVISDSDEAGKVARELVRALALKNPDMPLVFYSCYEIPSHLFEDAEHPYRVVNKPNHKELLSLISQLLGWPMKGFSHKT